jgi:hypothetical protein
MTAVNPRLALAIAKYLCRHRSVGYLRLALDLLKDPELREAWRELGVDSAKALAGGNLLLKAARIVAEHVEYLEYRGVAEFVWTVALRLENLKEVVYLPGVNVANWKGKPCTAPRRQTP